MFNHAKQPNPASIRCEINFPALPAITQGMQEERLAMRFARPCGLHVAYLQGDVLAVIEAVERAQQAGHWCVGFVSYEAAAAFDAAMVTKPAYSAKKAPNGKSAVPLAWFAEFKTPLAEVVNPAAPPSDDSSGYTVGIWQRDTDDEAFAHAVEAIRADIHNGRFYQVNYTTRLLADFSGDAELFYHALQLAQPNGYHVFIDAGDFQLLSVSPELFFSVRDGIVTTQPMKGTAPRGDNASEDAAIAHALTHSPKERAENLMIVDLLRNDLSRIAQSHSVEVPHLFSLHPLPSVWQMTSTVRATLREGKTLTHIFSALFPCGSVTGAPKVEAMKAIRDLEATPRGAYCGAIGYVAPAGVACFNVGIRSVWIADGIATCGVGSGITYDSTVEGEAAELAYKLRFVSRASKPFSLFETIRLDEGEYTLLDRHLARLTNSARHFRFAQDSESVLSTALSKLNWLKSQYPYGVWRVRLLLDCDGQCSVECYALDAMPLAPMVARAREAVSRFDEFLQHKTTRRETYEQYQPSAESGLWDTLLYNELGELTEFTRANLVLDIDGERLTPALRCGLLNGTLRDELIATNQIRETTLTAADLARAEKIWWVNSLRGEVLVHMAALTNDTAR
jgi:para-aminobenzoate synthetase / 4-amino-4-deoxychorismate lyase